MKLSDKVSPQILKYKCVQLHSRFQSCPALCNSYGYSSQWVLLKYPDTLALVGGRKQRQGTGASLQAGEPKETRGIPGKCGGGIREESGKVYASYRR